MLKISLHSISSSFDDADISIATQNMIGHYSEKTPGFQSTDGDLLCMFIFSFVKIWTAFGIACAEVDAIAQIRSLAR